MIDATGTRRRLQALAALGWRCSDLALLDGQLGLEELRRLLAGNVEVIATGVAYRVWCLYNQLSMVLGPSGEGRMAARQAGYAPPLAWDDCRIDDPAAAPEGAGWRLRLWDSELDWVAVERAVLEPGHDDELRPIDRREVVRRLHAAGMNDQQIARHLGCSDRTALRIRGALGLTANVDALWREGGYKWLLRHPSEVAS